MIFWKNVSKIFSSDLLAKPVKALDDVSFTVPEGSMVGFLGANGAGKTTSLKIGLGFTKASSGEVGFSPKLGSDRLSALKKTGFLPERPYFYPHLTGAEFSDYMAHLSGMDKQSILPRRTLLAERLGIAHALSRPLRTYSKGMLQRMGFLVAIQHNPSLVVLDEPLSGLDPVGRKELKDLIGEVHREGKTVFFSTHIVSDVEEICDRLVFLRQGKLVYEGGVRELLDKHPATSFRFVLQTTEDRAWRTPILSQTKTGQTMTIKVEAGLRDEFVQEVVANKVPLLSLNSEGARLEQIFYGINR